ncbi:uncharacterized protein TRIADDRAFT_54308 [Trichoplax adhaerens]|uniref:Calponin-homology (CH) domain-containing protein n=1 Tax=Trichoplax adhaerens TaxID=10228 RepID=B3RRN7_TRIAD|nr:hypothetical protein TRIADDRAFT_54308 [Trichoplax adhaerens]EDV26901.1 hypothetical protein TRIADDRAFT_54308 [Trichoplax adhaerens]|eukprot:XP_002110897.1 hypothetical protein TRIADDRAFT_54308 [Trichoplax adhaerens]
MAFSVRKSKKSSQRPAYLLEGFDRDALQLGKPNISEENFVLDEDESREMLKPRALEDAKVKELIECLTDWIHDELSDKHIIVRDILDDIYDGQVLAILTEKLARTKLDVPEIAQSVASQKERLRVVLDYVHRWLHPESGKNWSVEKVYSKNAISILQILVEISKQSQNPPKLPANVSMPVISVKMQDGRLAVNNFKEMITGFPQSDTNSGVQGRDVFDVLFEQTDEKLQVVKRSLTAFANKHLSKVNIEVYDIETQFHNGVNFIILTGLLEGYFVPFHKYYKTPSNEKEKIHNVSFALDLMEQNEELKIRVVPADVVSKDIKSTLRVLYHLFSLYKTID